jgi:hypothetical protein
MSVWYCIPSKRPPEEAEKCLKLWRERGYKIALWLDNPTGEGKEGFATKNTRWAWDIWQRRTNAPDCDLIASAEKYPGYAAAVNQLIRIVLCEALPISKDAEWLVTGGDDVEPDANHSAEEIARQCSEYFDVPSAARFDTPTFGVMQPTGDRYGADERHLGERGSAYIDRVCGSPWMGREFCRRMYGGRGPLCEEYFHMGEDEELQAVAMKLGVLWQRADLIHFHRHWARKNKSRDDMPKFLERANSPEEWQKYKQIFAERKAAGFPGHEPLEA